MKEPKASNKSNKPEKTQSILAKLFGKKKSAKHSDKKLRDHGSEGEQPCDENGNPKSTASEGEKSVRTNATKSGNRKRRARFFFFRRKKSKTEISPPPIYVEISPAKSNFMPDLISHDIRLRENSYEENSSKYTPEQTAAERLKLSKSQTPMKKSEHKEDTVNIIQPKNRFDDSTIIGRKQTGSPFTNSSEKYPKSLHDTKRTHSFNSRINAGNASYRNRKPVLAEAENDVSPSDYANMCRKSNLMLQNANGPTRQLDRSFLRWNSTADLQSQTSKERSGVSQIYDLPVAQTNDKSLSLQDLSIKSTRCTQPDIKPTSSRPNPVEVVPESTKLSKVRPSLDKALSKSEYDLRHVHASPSSRGILTFKKVSLPNVPKRRPQSRPRSAILPANLSIIGEIYTGMDVDTSGLSSTACPGYNKALEIPQMEANTVLEAQYVEAKASPLSYISYDESFYNANHVQNPHKNSSRTLSRTHSFQERYSPPLLRAQARQRDQHTRPKSCIQQPYWCPPVPSPNENPHPSQSTPRRGAAVSRSRSRARSIAKRFNISSSTDNLSPSKFAIYKTNNWNSTDVDANPEYCTMKPLLFDISTESNQPQCMLQDAYEGMPYTMSQGITQHNSEPFRFRETPPRSITFCYGNSHRTASSYTDRVVIGGPCRDQFKTSANRQKVFYALDV